MRKASRRPAGENREGASFERRSRQAGGTSRSYSSSVSAPAQAVKQRNEALILAVLAVVLPPAAIAYWWYNGKLEFRTRIVATVLLFALMTLYFSWLIPAPKPETFQPTIVKPQAVTEYSPSSSASDGAVQ